MKCINCQTIELKITKDVPNPKWCSTACKEQFYIDNFAGSALVEVIEHQLEKKKNLDREFMLREFEVWKNKNPGKGFVDMLQELA